VPIGVTERFGVSLELEFATDALDGGIATVAEDRAVDAVARAAR
jgi:hypothetical protein